MKKMYTYKFIINFLLLVCISQQGLTQTTDTLPKYPDIYGLRLGIDLLSASRNLWDNDFTGVDLMVDFRVDKQWYAAFEGGFVNKYKDEDRMNFTTKGSYIRIGADKNLHKNWLDMNNMIYFGGRYGFALFEQQLHNYHIIIPDDYIDELIIPSGTTYSSLHAHWIELVAGTKAEVAHNLFLGISFRLHGLLYQKQPEDFENLYIPGFGKKYSGNIGASFNYTISYLIPMKKKFNNKSFQ